MSFHGATFFVKFLVNRHFKMYGYYMRFIINWQTTQEGHHGKLHKIPVESFSEEKLCRSCFDGKLRQSTLQDERTLAFANITFNLVRQASGAELPALAPEGSVIFNDMPVPRSRQHLFSLISSNHRGRAFFTHALFNFPPTRACEARQPWQVQREKT